MRNILLLIVLLFSSMAFGQGQVGINTEDPKATLDIVGGNTAPVGVIAPRVPLSYLNDNAASYTEAQTGTIVFITALDVIGTGPTENVDGSGYYYFDGERWLRFVVPDVIPIPTEPWRDAETKEEATSNTQNIYQNGQVTIGKEGAGEASAQLDVTSSDKGFLVPRLDNRQRDAIADPAQALLIWNTEENCFNFWKSGKWRSMCGDMGEAVIKINPVDCAAAIVNGDYQVGTATNSSNYIELTLQVVEPGTYTIEGQTGKGFFFQRSGSFSEAGTFTIPLYAVGTPNEAGIWNFPLTLNGNLFDPSCTKQVTVDPADVLFTFDPSYCGTKAYSDELVRGEASTGKTTKIKINVVNPGTFSFTTNTVNGVQYTANNVVLGAGSHEVILTANGNAPTASGTNVAFSVTGTGLNGAACDILVDIIENDATLTAECGSATVAGTYRIDVSTTAANYIDIPVTFATTGNWTGTATSTGAGFDFAGNGTVNTAQRQTVRLYAQGTPTSGGVKQFTITVNGVTCNINVNVVMTTKKVLYLGGGAPARNALTNTSNFGPTGKSLVESVQLVNGGANPSAASLINSINNNNVEVIIAGWEFDVSDEASRVIADFIRNKKGFFFQVEAQDQQDYGYLNRILDKAFSTTVAFTPDEMTLRVAKFPNEDNPLLNGVFGDVRGKYVRSDDDASWIGMTPASSGAFSSLIQLPAKGSYPARNLFSYAPGFCMIPDWGMTNYYTGVYGTNSPIGYSTVGETISSGYTWDGTGYSTSSTVISTGQTGNWILFGNIMDQAFKYVQENIVKDYKVDTNYSE